MPKTSNTSYPELIQNAQHLFWMKGFKAVTPKDLSEKLNVSISAIYNKYGKDLLFIEALNAYVASFSDPTLKVMRESTEGIETFREAFYQIIDALLDGGFPKSCLMVNTVVEVKNEIHEVNLIYSQYFSNIRASYMEVLNRAYQKGELKNKALINDYVEFLVGIIFGLSILYKVKSRKELRAHIDEQLSLIT